MAIRLEDMLRPGERVLWRSRWNWVPAFWPVALVAIGTLAYLLAWSDFENRVPAALLLGALLAGWLFNAFVRSRTRALITERRVIYRSGYGPDEATELPLAEVARVKGPEPRARRRDGTAVEFRDLRQGWRFARVLARAAGVPYGPRGARREGGDALAGIVAWAAVASVLVLLITLWAEDIADGALPGFWTALVFGLGIPIFLGPPETRGAAAMPFRALALPLLRPFAPAAWARDWLCRKPASGTAGGSSRRDWTWRSGGPACSTAGRSPASARAGRRALAGSTDRPLRSRA
ncbi:MAG: hypothetical protein OEM59_18925 [Rhodospirillales bacterium]|nr:hypothetical protein [Rhodospirillales bacterium]